LRLHTNRRLTQYRGRETSRRAWSPKSIAALPPRWRLTKATRVTANSGVEVVARWRRSYEQTLQPASWWTGTGRSEWMHSHPLLPVHTASYNLYFSTCFFSWNSVAKIRLLGDAQTAGCSLAFL
jgi:hypothetical protein